MYECRVENRYGESITLTKNEEAFQIVSIAGLNPPNAQINTSPFASLDGARFNSSKLETRNIVLQIRLNGDVEANRLLLYRYFQTKEWCKFYYSNKAREVQIEGYVESVECAYFSSNEVMQISILCPRPYFKALDSIYTDISKEQPNFEFPFAFGAGSGTDAKIEFSSIDMQRITKVTNVSEVEVGAVITIRVSGSVNRIMIRNVVTGDTFTLQHAFIANDLITIKTNKGEKSVTLKRNGVESNIFSKMVIGSIFLTLAIGDNYFGYLADSGSTDELVHIEFMHDTLYRGV